MKILSKQQFDEHINENMTNWYMQNYRELVEEWNEVYYDIPRRNGIRNWEAFVEKKAETKFGIKVKFISSIFTFTL